MSKLRLLLTSDWEWVNFSPRAGAGGGSERRNGRNILMSVICHGAKWVK